MFYFMLGNINPSMRSKLKGIQLLGICKSNLIKVYGINSILKPIVDDIKKLVITPLHMYTDIQNGFIAGMWIQL